MVIAKARKLSARPKIFLFSKRVKDYGNSLADICLVMQIVGQGVGIYLDATATNYMDHTTRLFVVIDKKA